MDSIVVFIDSLGSRAAANHEEAQDRLARISSALRRAHEVALVGLDNGPAGFDVVSFTDNLVVGYPIGPHDDLESIYGAAITTSAMYQLALSLEGIFCRGGIGRGGLWMDDLLVFGPGLVSAYELESRHAVYPRVVLAPEVAALAQDHVHAYYGSDFEESPQGTYLCGDSDGFCIVSYLAAAELLGDLRSIVALHADRVRSALSENKREPRIHEKFVWAVHYHNFVCVAYGLDDLTIAAEEYPLELVAFERWERLSS